jgi:RimJ/RimL family protein N-acetyltransferase
MKSATISIFETERLKIRDFTLDDAEFIIKLLNTEGWLKYIGDRNVKTTEQAIKYLENGPFKSYQDHGFGLWMVESKSDSQPVGMCGILKRNYLPNPDIGFAFLPEFNGLGYAFEAAMATMNYAKNVLTITVIDAITLEANSRSIKLLEKIGMKFIKPILIPGDNDELFLFSNRMS